MAKYTYPGEFTYDGVVYNSYFNLDSMIRVKDEMLLAPSDVVI